MFAALIPVQVTWTSVDETVLAVTEVGGSSGPVMDKAYGVNRRIPGSSSKTKERKLNTFDSRCLCNIWGMRWSDNINIKEVNKNKKPLCHQVLSSWLSEEKNQEED